MAYHFTNYGKTVHLLMNRVRNLTQIMRQQADQPQEGVGQEVKLFVPTLVLALRSPDESVRRAAAEFLGDLGAIARVAIPALRQAMHDREGSVRQQAQLALEKIRLEVRRAILCAA